MSKAVLISIQPKWCALIANGEKTVEVRKSKPKLQTPFKCYIYCTYGEGLIERHDPDYPNMLIGQKVSRDKAWGNCCNGKVIGEFVCDAYDNFIPTDHGVKFKRFSALHESQLSTTEIRSYLGGKVGYGWHISDLVIYDKPKLLSEFIKPCENDLYCEVCGMYSEFAKQCGNKALRLSRPPQSWCYVEELSRLVEGDLPNEKDLSPEN